MFNERENTVAIAILDFGSQYTQLIARRIREAGVYCEIVPFNTAVAEIKARQPKGLILSGGPSSVYDDNAPRSEKQLVDESECPVLGICYGLQILNVYRSGTLLQHIETAVNHEAGRKVPVAHEVEIEPGSKLAEIVGGNQKIPANSSHHQSADVIGDGLKIVARCPEDGIVEAIEGTAPDHFVVAVQWHPERSFDEDARSRKLFEALVEAAKQKHLELVGEFEAI